MLVAVLSATLNEDDFDFETDENMEQAGAELGAEHVSRRENYLLNSMDSKIDEKDETQKERLSHLKMQVLEKLKTTKLRRSSKRRYSDVGMDESGRSSSKPRTSSP